MDIDILMPTIKPYLVVRPMLEEIRRMTESPHRIAATCQAGYSAAQNRNLALKAARPGTVRIMLDDDMAGFFPGWDVALCLPLADPGVLLVSARLLTLEGKAAPTCADNYDLEKPLVEVLQREDGYIGVPTACIAFRDEDVWFDENFTGSGWEDSDFARSLNKKRPDGRFVINNGCKLIHLNEKKAQFDTVNGKPRYDTNGAYFWKKWGRTK